MDIDKLIKRKKRRSNTSKTQNTSIREKCRFNLKKYENTIIENINSIKIDLNRIKEKIQLRNKEAFLEKYSSIDSKINSLFQVIMKRDNSKEVDIQLHTLQSNYKENLPGINKVKNEIEELEKEVRILFLMV